VLLNVTPYPVPLTVTVVLPLTKLVPLIVTFPLVFAVLLPGLNPVIVGGGNDLPAATSP
jgi:hypothetical protein